ncbi:MAG: YdcF family protein [Nanoarchaeota archaeon]
MADKKFDAIVVLGAAVTPKGNLTRVAKSRIDKAIQLYADGAAPKIIVTGKNEASAMRRYAIKKGVKATDVLVESKARDTISNAFFTCKKFLLANSWRRIVVVTSIFHVPRARLIFRKVLGKSYNVLFVPSVRVLSEKAFKEKLRLEKGLLLLTKFLGTLIADGDLKAVENFLGRNPLYKQYGRVSSNRA